MAGAPTQDVELRQNSVIPSLEPLSPLSPPPSLVSSILAEPQGYPKLAAYMGKHNDVAIFRRFKNLNMLNLMSLQAELIDLEAQYRRACSEDDTNVNDPMAQQYSKIFAALYDSDNTGNHVQLDLLKQIRKTLEQYSMTWLGIRRAPGLMLQ